MLLALLIIGFFVPIFNVHAVWASGTICIRADGSLDPPGAPIQRNGDTYTLTDDLYITDSGDMYDVGIFVQRSQIIIDGSGHMIDGSGVDPGSSRGITISYSSNVTIKNTEIKACLQGIYLDYSMSNEIYANNITDISQLAIMVWHSSDNNISGNKLVATDMTDIGLYHSSNNIISRNNMTRRGHGGGISLFSSSNNSISENGITGSVVLGYSSNNSICENSITQTTGHGIHLEYSHYNNISGNSVADSPFVGIELYGSSYNLIYHNNFLNNTHQAQIPYPGTGNEWDNGYPSGGNYWSDYAGVDLKGGPNQDLPGSDGVGDTPYIIDDNNRDRYPLMNPWQVYAESLWPMFQHDPQHSSRAPLVGPGVSENPEISMLIGGSASDSFTTPVISFDGTVYFKALINGIVGLYAFAPNGTQKWFYPSPTCSYPTVVQDGSIYFYVEIERYKNISLRMISSDGNLKWERSFVGAYPVGYPAVDSNGIIYFLACSSAGDSGKLVALDPDTGDVLWTYEVQGYLGQQTPAIDQNGVVYFGRGDTLFAIGPDGTEKRRRIFVGEYRYLPPTTPSVCTPSIADDGTIYVVLTREKDWRTLTDEGYSNCLHAIDPENYQQDKWVYVSHWIGSGPVSLSSEGNVYLSGGYAPAGSWITSLFGFDSQGNNLPNWPLSLGYVGMANLLVVDNAGIIYGLFGEHTVKAFHGNGSQIWSLYLQERRYDLLSIGKGGTLYVPGSKWLYAIQSTSPDFSITASPASLAIQQGSSGTSQITVTSMNGFNQPVQLTVSGAPTGVTATLNPVQVTPPPDGSISSTLSISVSSTATPGSYTLTVTGTSGTLVHSTNLQLEVGSTPDQPPDCDIRLQKNGIEINQIDVGEFFDINASKSTDDKGIVEIRFSSDDLQDNHPTGVWTQWYDWSVSSGDWNAQTKIKRWSFGTPGYKEVWAEIKDDIGQTDAHLANIYVPGSQPPTCVVRLQKNGVEIADIDVGKSFDIYVGGSTDDAAIVQICFSSDDSQNDYPSGVWTDWYSWSTSSGDWDTIGKTMKWSFSTSGRKEVWAMVKDSDGNAVWNHADVFVHPGYAIIVSGSGDWGRTFDHCANNVYRVLRNLGFNDDHVYYLNSVNQDVDGDGDSEVDGYASYTWFTWAINQVKDKIGNDPTPLIIYLVGHGSASAFTFDDGTGPDSFLFDSGGIPPPTKGLQEMLAEFPVGNPMFVMINSCYSGCFITSTQGGSGSISSANRIIITTAHDDQETGVAGWYFNERHAFTWVRSSDRFWANLNNGLNVKEAYVRRADAGDNWHMWLDDNGDKSGHPPNNLGDDGELAAITKIGIPGTESLKLTPWQYIWKYSPGELRVYDSQNRVTGLVNGHVREEIPSSIYFEQYELVGIFSSSDTYCYEIVGTETGTYGLSIASVEGADTTVFTAIGIPETVNSIHQYTVDWTILSQGGVGVTVKIDSNGDGIFERTPTSDSELTRDEFLGAGPPQVPVGGEWIPIDKVQLLAPWIRSVSLMMMLVTSFVYVKRKKKQQN